VGLTLVTPPTQEPISLDEALAHCRVTDDSETGLIVGYLMAARQFAEDFTRCALLQQSIDYTIDFGWPMIRTESPYYAISPYFFYRTRVELPRRPLLNVQWVRYIDVDGVTQTLDPSQYIVVGNEVVPYIEQAFGVTWPITRYQPAAIQVRFDAGFGKAMADIPETIRQAILMLVAFWFDNRGSAQFGARARLAAGEAVTSSIMPAEMPPAVIALLSAYAVPRVLC
jgi:uncharacterized phiE125 gp8 family phage protein